MTREQYVRICKMCAKRDFNSSKGIVCSLTQEHADFQGKCENFVADEKLVQKRIDQQEFIKAQERKSESRDASLDLGLGALFFIGGIILTVSDLGYIFYGAILYGLYRLIIGFIALKS